MTRSISNRSRSLSTAILTALALSSATAGQTTPEERDRPPVVEMIKAGDGIPVLLRWNPPEDRTARNVLVSVRTAPSTVPRPTLEGSEPDVVLQGFTRPPLERIWTLTGQITKNDSGSSSARWRVVDGAARVIGVEGLARARAGEEKKPAEDAGAEKSPEDGGDGETTDAPGIGATKPATPTPPSGPGRQDPREQNRKRIGNGANSIPTTSNQKALDQAMRIEAIADEAVARTGGATISQTLSEGGLDPTSMRVRLLKTDRRASYEMQALLDAMRLAVVQLPSQPVSPGASWKTGWDGLVMNVPMRTEATWTLVKTDEAAQGTNIARTATIRIEYQRRLRDPGDAPNRRELQMEADGRGELVLDLNQPLMLDARLVEQPVLDPGPGRSRLVTRYRLEPVGSARP